MVFFHDFKALGTGSEPGLRREIQDFEVSFDEKYSISGLRDLGGPLQHVTFTINLSDGFPVVWDRFEVPCR